MVTRILVAVGVVVVGVVTFSVTWIMTEPTVIDCNDNPTSVAAICAAPGRSLLPAFPVAMLTGLAMSVALVVRRRLRGRSS